MRTQTSSSGFTLVEIVAALGLLAVTLVAVGRLAATARRSIEAGRTSSAALGVARGILDQIDDTGFESTWRALGVDGSTASARVDSRGCPWADTWQTILGRSLGRAHAEIDLATIAPDRSTPLAAAAAIRVVVTIHWTEGLRARRVRLVTVRA